MATRGPLNSAEPTTSILISGVYNAQAPAPADEQVCALQLDSEGNLLVNVMEGGGVLGSVKIEDSSGNALNSNGSGALQVAVVSGGGSNPSVGLTGAAAPTSATEIGIIDGSGKLQGASSSNPVPVSGTVAVSNFPATQPVSIASGQVASGAFASGSIASGAIASGAIASGAIAAGAAAAGAFADGSVYVRSNAAATFPVTATIAAAQTIAVTNAGTFAVQASGTVTANQGTAGAVTAPWPTRPGSPMTASWLQLPINVSGLGANIIVPAVGGQTVRVMRIFFVNSDPTNATNVTVQDTSPTSFTGPVRLITAGSFNGQDSNGEPLFVSGTGQGIQINSTAAVQLSGTVWYTQS